MCCIPRRQESRRLTKPHSGRPHAEAASERFTDSSRKAGVGDWTCWMWKFRKVAPLLALLVLASCADETSRGVTSIGSHTFGRARGIDMATDARDHLNELKHSRLDFIARYYRDPASRWADALREGGATTFFIGLIDSRCLGVAF